MSETVIVALLSLLGTLGGTLGGILATGKRSKDRLGMPIGIGRADIVLNGFCLTCQRIVHMTV